VNTLTQPLVSPRPWALFILLKFSLRQLEREDPSEYVKNARPNRDHDAHFQSLSDNSPFSPTAPLEARRRILDSLGSLNPPLPGDVTAQHVEGKGWTAKMIKPPNADPNRLILYVHGGGFTMGSVPAIWEYPVYRIARAAEPSY